MLNDKVQKIKDYVASLGIAYRIEPDPNLSLDNPGTYRNGVIRVYDKLSDDQRLEAEAHELCHAILEHQGVLSLDVDHRYCLEQESVIAVSEKNYLQALDQIQEISDEDNEKLAIRAQKLGELSSAVSNATHHKAMMPMLLDTFEIVPNEYHVLMRRLLVNLEADLQTEDLDRLDDYASGVRLYDMLNILPTECNNIERISCMHNDVQKSFIVAKCYLNQLDTKSTIAEQIAISDKFFVELGLDPHEFKQYDPKDYFYISRLA